MVTAVFSFVFVVSFALISTATSRSIRRAVNFYRLRKFFEAYQREQARERAKGGRR